MANKDLISHNKGIIRVGVKKDATALIVSWEGTQVIKWKNYTIKETDMRVKTATFTSPVTFDLTEGQHVVHISHPSHEPFAGIILSREYDPETGLSTYQCQDFSRNYISKFEFSYANVPVYNFLRVLLTRGELTPYPKKENLEKYSKWLSGLKPLATYDQERWGSIIRFNPFSGKTSVLIQDKSFIDVIRDFAYGSGAYVDVFFDIYGVCHIQPYHKKDFFERGLHLSAPEIGSRKYKFDTANIVTGVHVKSSEKNGASTFWSSKKLVNLNLEVYFGKNAAMINKPNQSSSSNNNSSTSKKQDTTNTKNTSNPYGNKSKKIWIGADSGSGDFKNDIISKLRSNGWECHDSGTGPNVHYEDYWNVTSDYQVLAIVDNGFDPATVMEAYEGSVKSELEKKVVTCMCFFDTRSWTEGMRPYRYGDFTGYHSHRAWDDNYSNFSGSLNVKEYFESNNIKYCASPDVEGIVAQFLAGGYFAYKEKGG